MIVTVASRGPFGRSPAAGATVTGTDRRTHIRNIKWTSK